MRHFYSKVPGWFHAEGLYREAVEKAPEGGVLVEVGAWKGKSASFMGVEIANSGKKLEFYAVDHWEGSDEEAHHKDKDVQNGTLFSTFIKNVSPVIDFIRPMRTSSELASCLFQDQSVDFIFLDGDHTYEGVRTDIVSWMPKMKAGGIISGDDLNWRGVQAAVDEFFPGRYEVLGEGKHRHWKVQL